jgi:hypothetical protein
MKRANATTYPSTFTCLGIVPLIQRRRQRCGKPGTVTLNANSRRLLVGNEQLAASKLITSFYLAGARTGRSEVHGVSRRLLPFDPVLADDGRPVVWQRPHEIL